MTESNRIILNKGVGLTSVKDDRFKTEYMSLRFIMERDPGKLSLYHILPSLLMRGSEKYPNIASLSRALEDTYDTNISYDVSMAGDSVAFAFTVNFISDKMLDEEIPLRDRSVAILADIILHPLMTDGKLSETFTELEKDSLLDVLRSEKDNKRSYAIGKCRSLLYEGTRFEISKYGTKESVNAVSAESLTSFYLDMIENAAVEFFYDGSEDLVNIEALIKKNFNKLLKDRNTDPRKFSLTADCVRSDLAVKEEKDDDCDQTSLIMGFRMPEVKREVLMLFHDIMSLSTSSRLFMNVREKYGLCYDCFMMVDRHKNSCFTVSGIEKARREQAIDAILHELSDIASGNIQDGEFASAKKACISSLRSLCDSRSAVDRKVMDIIMTGEQDENNFNIDDAIKNCIDNITKVKKEDIANFAKGISPRCVFTLIGGKSE